MRTVLAIACATALGGCAIIVAPDGNGDYQVHNAFSSVEGNGVIAREQRSVGTVPGLSVGDAMVVDVRVGPATSLTVEAESNILPLIRSEVRGDTLSISSTSSYHSHNPVHIIYTVPRLTDLRQGGAARVTVQDLNGQPLSVHQGGSGTLALAGQVASLEIDSSGSSRVQADALQTGSARLSLSGSAHMDVGQVRGDYAVVSVSGSGRLHMGGAVHTLTARSSGAGQLDLANLASVQGDLSTSGSGGITANVKEALIAETSGSGSIRVYGNPAQRNVSGRHVQVLN
ncbi:MAG TPA: DUF2807 domain-containing protein [Telluria sp.]|jgi:hypothetical protein